MKFKDEVKLVFDEYPGAATKLIVIALIFGTLVGGAVF